MKTVKCPSCGKTIDKLIWITKTISNLSIGNFETTEPIDTENLLCPECKSDLRGKPEIKRVEEELFGED